MTLFIGYFVPATSNLELGIRIAHPTVFDAGFTDHLPRQLDLARPFQCRSPVKGLIESLTRGKAAVAVPQDDCAILEGFGHLVCHLWSARGEFFRHNWDFP
jgi:hypothetical protein